MKYLKNVVTLKLYEEKCTGCRRCIEVCPRGVILMFGGKAEISDIDLCIECGACESNCEFNAVEVRRGVGCAAAIIGGMLSGGEPECGCSCSESRSSCC
jgi:NAD-dependent dihydropyrimidine dehydrogenase PreA subunit